MLSTLRRLFASPESRAPAPRCGDCETPEGELHALFCTKERCPFCGGQLASCGCIHQVLVLTEEERKSLEEYLDDTVEPLRQVMERWEEELNRKGRVPYIEYPNVCARCGALWPEFSQPLTRSGSGTSRST
jgi:hypothetical protein